ncbi:hypothetical protein [Bifidobacterium aerophilum]|uniref:Signal transduction histidine kinase subgroup 3 dimerisation and phosphoacceptor domain-containing protein n=1 Tax=Bifidobacterium aerophilum TaxID=1798155 RepID=A0A6N9Z3L4_9BIFI|nr:hypothetical protein [Bifidobacterium aerophilum]NEG88783.1 hypothetical protein [Bifidobacterium aerophilum]
MHEINSSIYSKKVIFTAFPICAALFDLLSYVPSIKYSSFLMNLYMTIHILSLLLFPLLSKIAIYPTIINYLATLATPGTYCAYQTWGIHFAIAFLGFKFKFRKSATLLLLILAVDATMQTIQMNGLPSIVATYGNYFTAYILGYTIRLNQKLVSAYIREHDRKISQQLHESATNELSSILLIAQNTLQTGKTSREKSLQEIIVLAKMALLNIHNSIRILNNKPVQNNALSVFDYIKQQEQQLISLKRYGKIYADDIFKYVNDPFIVNILREIFSNIIRHAPLDSTYTLSLCRKDGTVVLKESNGIDPQSDISSGFGLSFIQDELKTKGGSLSSSISDDIWEITITVPYHE